MSFLVQRYRRIRRRANNAEPGFRLRDRLVQKRDGEVEAGARHARCSGWTRTPSRPRLKPGNGTSPASDVLVEGMFCNVEPGIYVEGFDGIRHCDMVLVTACGAEVLTGFHQRMEEWVIDHEN